MAGSGRSHAPAPDAAADGQGPGGAGRQGKLRVIVEYLEVQGSSKRP